MKHLIPITLLLLSVQSAQAGRCYQLFPGYGAQVVHCRKLTPRDCYQLIPGQGAVVVKCSRR